MHQLDGRLTAQKNSLLQRRLASAAARARAPRAAVAVDYPRSGERVVSREYAFRISAPAPGGVEISIDGEAWLPCREAAGYWWRDWSDYRAGRHTAVARVNLQNGRRLLSERRAFFVE